MPYFAANISDGHLFNSKSLPDRIAACLECGFEAVEISQPYAFSAPSLASLLGDDSSAESLEMACIDSHAPSTSISLPPSSPSPLPAFPRGHMGWAAVPGEIAAFCSSLERTIMYASALQCKTVNLLMGIPHHTFDAIADSVEVLGLARGASGSPDAIRIKLTLPLRESTGVSQQVIETSIPITHAPLSYLSSLAELPTYSTDPRAAVADTKALTLMRRLLPAPLLQSPCLSQTFAPAFLPEVAEVYRRALARNGAGVEGVDTARCVALDDDASTPVDILSPGPLSVQDVSFPTPPLAPSSSPFTASSYPHLFARALPPALAHSFPDALLASLAFTISTVTVAHASQLVRSRLGPDSFVALEPVSDVPGYALTSVHQLLRLLVHVGADNVGIVFDCYHMARLHGSVTETLAGLMPLIRHVQIGSVPGREEPDRGELNGPHVLRQLDRLRYQGWAGLEYRPAPGRTRQGLEGWFSTLQCRRHGSAGILFTCVGKQGRPYALLGQDHKKGNPWGPFWGRPDKDDRDAEWTAVRETLEESLGVIGDATLLYSALKNEGFHYKLGTVNLYLVHLGVLGLRERDAIVARYAQCRDASLASLTRCEAEVLAVQWVDFSDLYKQLMKGKGEKGDPIKLRGFFRRELVRAMEVDPVMQAFCQKQGIALRPLSELVQSSEGDNTQKWNSAPV